MCWTFDVKINICEYFIKYICLKQTKRLDKLNLALNYCKYFVFFKNTVSNSPVIKPIGIDKSNKYGKYESTLKLPIVIIPAIICPILWNPAPAILNPTIDIPFPTNLERTHIINHANAPPKKLNNNDDNLPLTVDTTITLVKKIKKASFFPMRIIA